MTTKAVRFFIVSGLVMVLGATSAHAQWFKITATIPFEFDAGDRKFPAGSCTFERPQSSPTGMKANLNIRCGKASGVVLTQDPGVPRHDRGQTKNQLIFNRYDKRHFLQEVWINGVASGVPSSGAERELVQRGVEASAVVLKVKQ